MSRALGRRTMPSMNIPAADNERYLCQLRLLLEELCCDLCRFEHVTKDRCAPECVQVDREYYLHAPGAFADIRVVPPETNEPGGAL